MHCWANHGIIGTIFNVGRTWALIGPTTAKLLMGNDWANQKLTIAIKTESEAIILIF